MKNLFVGKNIIEIGNFKIAFYAVCILLGAIATYKLSQYFLKKKGYDPNAIENLLYIAFPAGIIGARIWWIIAEGKPFTDIYKIYEGGLAIQGGVLLGAVVGIIFMIKRRPNIPVLIAADCIVPSILIAQAIGRWGNFFNQEVYGSCVDKWNFLPSFITDRLSISLNAAGNNWATSNFNGELFKGADGLYYLCEGTSSQMVVPLFLIESVVNVIGFCLIMFALTALFNFIKAKTNNKIHLANGDLMCSYLIWYGIVRMILEPLRNPKFIMGVNNASDLAKANMKSFVMSIVFIALGIIGIVFCHLYEKKWQKKVLDTNVISGSEAEKDSLPLSEKNEDKKEEK